MSVQKSSTETRVLVEPPILKITGPVSFEAPDTAALLQRLAESERLDQLRRILELGTQAAGAIDTSATLRMVEAELAALSQDLSVTLKGQLINDRAEAQKVLKELLDDHRDKLTSSLTRYLDPESQASLPVAMEKVFDQAGTTLVKQIEVLLSEGDESALGRLADRFSKELQQSTALIIQQLAAKQAISRTSLAGRPYEEALEIQLTNMARPLGDTVTRCADLLGASRRRSGDLTVNISSDAVWGRTDVCIVVEAKLRGEQAAAFSHTAIKKQLDEARKNRSAQAALFVTAEPGLLPLGIGFHEYGSSDIAVAWGPTEDEIGLAVAYRLLRYAAIEAVRGSPSEELDREAHQRIVADIRAGITKLETVHAQHSAAINSIGKAESTVSEVKASVLDLLRQLEELMAP